MDESATTPRAEVKRAGVIIPRFSYDARHIQNANYQTSDGTARQTAEDTAIKRFPKEVSPMSCTRTIVTRKGFAAPVPPQHDDRDQSYQVCGSDSLFAT